MKILKTISTAVMLITGILTALMGFIESMIKFSAIVLPQPPKVPMMEKSLRGMLDYIAVPRNTFWIEYQGVFILLIGIFICYLSLWASYKYND